MTLCRTRDTQTTGWHTWSRRPFYKTRIDWVSWWRDATSRLEFSRVLATTCVYNRNIENILDTSKTVPNILYTPITNKCWIILTDINKT